ncbi:MAG: hypothetical protein MO852_17455, partial [Candidatus Devosia euplotis]|nr:hypothetical protein [Candidatus Devosia euplotis]
MSETDADADAGGGADTAVPMDPSNPPAPMGPGDARVPGDICERVDTQARPVIPRMLILSDRSYSMTELRPSAGGIRSRWDGSVSAIKSVTAELDGEIDFGLLMFPSIDSVELPNGAKCEADDVSVYTGPGSAP